MVVTTANATYVLDCGGVTLNAQCLQMPATPASINSDALSDDGMPMSPGGMAVSPTGGLSSQHNGGGKLKSRLKPSVSGL